MNEYELINARWCWNFHCHVRYDMGAVRCPVCRETLHFLPPSEEVSDE